MAPALVVPLVGLLAGSAVADGGFVGREEASLLSKIASTAQKAVIIELPEGREALLLQTTYHGPTEDFAWIVPVPGLPAKEDVFEASPRFIDVLLRWSRPRTKTTTNGQQVFGPDRPGGLGGGLGGGLRAEAVTVHERMAVGIYDVAVLSAIGVDPLADWLTEHGYGIPEGSGPILDHYVRKHWYFVALKIQPKAVGGGRVLSDVEPIGIRFDTETLVYPLTISRISSREKTSLLLLALTASDVQCDQLREIELPLGQLLPAGTSYARVRRELVESGAPGLIREYCAPFPRPSGGLDYEKRSGSSPPERQETSEGSMRITRWWTILERDAMKDLTFSSWDEAPAGRVTIVREAQADLEPRQRLRNARRDPLGEALAALDDMLLRFRRQYGCWPARLQDMVGRDLPEVGVDSSGNPVPLPANVPWHRPLGATPVVRELPTDPLTGRSDTWVYEPTGDPMVGSGGYTITLHVGSIY